MIMKINYLLIKSKGEKLKTMPLIIQCQSFMSQAKENEYYAYVINVSVMCYSLHDTHTVNVRRTLLKFLFPDSRFFMALEASFGLQKYRNEIKDVKQCLGVINT